MLAELEPECGICYRVYNSARRCPRLLGCKHRFCEACLLRQGSVCSPGDSDSQPHIVCALCRHHTVLTAADLRENLPRDEELLQRLRTAGAPENSDDEDDEEPEPEAEKQSKEESSPTTGRGKVWRAMKKLYSKVRGSDRTGCMTDAEMRDLTLMSCYMI